MRIDPPCPVVDLCGSNGRAWLSKQVLSEDERLAVEPHLREFDRLGEDLPVIERNLAGSALADENVARLMATPLRHDRGARHHRSRRQNTLIRLFEELRGLGYDGGYDAVRRYAREWNKERGASTAAAYVPLIFAPGEAYQFDWSHEVVLLSGVKVIVKAAHVRLCRSRMLFVRVYPREKKEMVFDAHDRAFALLSTSDTKIQLLNQVLPIESRLIHAITLRSVEYLY